MKIRLYTDKREEWPKGRKRRRPVAVRYIRKNPAPPVTAGTQREMTIKLPDYNLTIHSVLGVANILECTPVRVLQLIRERKLPAHRVGKEWIVFGPDLEIYMEDRAEKLRKRYRRYLEFY